MELLTVNPYINPISVEAAHFLQTIRKYRTQFPFLDDHLSSLLATLLLEFKDFVESRVSFLRNGEVDLVPVEKLGMISRMFHCDTCKRDLGKDLLKVQKHIYDEHIEAIERAPALGKNRTEGGKQQKAKNGGKPQKEKDDGKPQKEKDGSKPQKAKEDDAKAKAAAPKKRSKLRKADRSQSEENDELKTSKLPKKAKALIRTNFNLFFTESTQVGEKLKQIPEYDAIENDLLTILKPEYPDKTVKLYKFGSRMTGTATRNSDLDLYVDIDNQFHIYEHESSIETIVRVRMLAASFWNNPKQWTNVVLVDKARVPIVKVQHKKSGIDLDIGFSNGLAFCNTRLVEYLFGLQPIACRMVMFLKRWLERCKLSKHITTYTLTLLAIHFLQQKEHLPPIARLQENLPATMQVGPWSGNFLTMTNDQLGMERVAVDTQTCQQFLYEFFQYYGDYNYTYFVICPYYGSNIHINDFKGQMPKRYLEFTNDEKEKSLSFPINKRMLVQDPLQLNRNVAVNVTKDIMDKLVVYLKESAKAFEGVEGVVIKHKDKVSAQCENGCVTTPSTGGNAKREDVGFGGADILSIDLGVLADD